MVHLTIGTAVSSVFKHWLQLIPGKMHRLGDEQQTVTATRYLHIQLICS